MNIGLGEFVLAIVSFVVGTLFPIIYRRFSHEGISIKQPFAVDIFISAEDKDSIFATVIKIANAQKDSALLDDILLELPARKGVRLQISDIKIKVYSPGDLIYAPIDIPVQISGAGREEKNLEYQFPENSSYAVLHHQTELTYLPLIIKSEEEKLVAIQFTMPRYLNEEISHEDLYAEREKKRIRILFRINGKYRKYAVHLRQHVL